MSETDEDYLPDNHDTDMKYTQKALEVITFKTVYDEADLESDHEAFHPTMAHQVFGQEETITGYEQLAIRVFYLHNSGKCYLRINAVESTKCARDKIQNIEELMKPWLPQDYTTDLEQFKREIAAEEHERMFGTVITTFEDERKYTVTQCTASDGEFKLFHQRFETLLVWFIDGANHLSLDDLRWIFYYVYEECTDPKTEKRYVTPIAFSSVYTFFLSINKKRMRISQFFVLPPRQRKGIGKQLYITVTENLRSQEDVQDIQVEEPSEVFQLVRNIIDTTVIKESLSNNNVDIASLTLEEFHTYYQKSKLSRRQELKVFDILKLMALERDEHKYNKFLDMVKTRIRMNFERETRGGKMMGDTEREAMRGDSRSRRSHVQELFDKYMSSLSRAIKHLK